MSLPPQFASDNYAGICPEALAALLAANVGHEYAYGEDDYTQRVTDRIRDLFETDCEVFFVFNGTAANALALASLCQSYHGIICTDVAHVATDECGAPEFFSNGSKLITTPASNGKLTAHLVRQLATKRSDLHFPKVKGVTITQATEVGTLYSAAEIRSISTVCKELGLSLHMDGARFANALAQANCTPAELTWQAGVDVLCLGGTKNGLPIGDMVVFFNKALAVDFEYRCKQAGQLCSKMRYLSAPWLGILENNVWLDYARNANHCAQLLARSIAKIPGVSLMFPTEANGVFVEIPPPAQEKLREKGWRFYTFIGAGGVRLMCAWDMTEERVHEFVADLTQIMLQ